MQPIELELKQRPNETLPHRCGAFVIPIAYTDPDSAARGIVELLTACIVDETLRGGSIYLLPRSAQDLSASGVVWISSATEADIRPPVGAVSLRRAAPGCDLWIPQAADLCPAIDPQTMSSIAGDHSLVRVWLPSIGMVGFTGDDVVRVEDWLAPPACDRELSPWQAPIDLWSPPQRLAELTMLEPPSAVSFLGDLQEELGIPPRSLLDTDASGQGSETPGAAKKLKDWLLGKLDRMAEKRAQAKRSPSAKPSETYAQHHLASGQPAGGRSVNAGGMIAIITAPIAMAMARMLEGERNRQIEKLLRMMTVNPDQALKFAIPLGAIGDAFRGFAMPGAALLARMTDFSLGGLSGGGQAAEMWSIDSRLQIRLQQKYREQANRELAAGRYRRAAYIFAHLLADFRSAASALEKGRFFAEAAVLYRDKLNDKPAAAVCLARGGMYAEACELLVSLDQFEKAGDVWLEAEQSEKALEMFERAYKVMLSRGEIVPAAHLLCHRMGRREQATELLLDQWPAGSDVLRAGMLAMTWMGEDGRHEESQRRLDEMSVRAGEQRVADFAQLTAQVSKNYPDDGIRIAAEDHCRLAVSRSLRSDALIDRHATLSVIADLNPSDAQLTRDSLEFRRRLAETPTSQPKLPRQRNEPRELNAMAPLQLPPGPSYVDFRMVTHSAREQLLAIVIANETICVVHAPNQFDFSKINRSYAVLLDSAKPALAVCPALLGYVSLSQRESIVAHVYGAIKQSTRVDAAQVQDLPTITMQAEPLHDIVATASADRASGGWSIRCSDDSIVLDHAVEPSHDLTGIWVDAWNGDGPVSIEETHGHFKVADVHGEAVVAINRNIHALRGGVLDLIHTSWGFVTDLVPSLPHSRARVAIAHNQGLDLIYMDSGELVSICREQQYNHAVWAPNGRLLALCDDALHQFELRGKTATRIARSPIGQDKTPVKLLLLSHFTIGIAYDTGRIDRYRLPR